MMVVPSISGGDNIVGGGRVTVVRHHDIDFYPKKTAGLKL